MKHQLLTLDEVIAIVRVGKSTVYRMMRDGEFPSSVKVGGCARWREHEIEAWARELPSVYCDDDPASYKGARKRK